MTYDPDERKQLERAIAERAAYLERLRNVGPVVSETACNSDRTREISSREEVVSKSAAALRRAQPMTNITAEWQNWITAEVREAEQRTLTLAMEVCGEAMGRLKTDLRREFKDQLERELLALRNEFLAAELDRERGVKRPLRVVSPVQSEQLIG